MQVKIYCYIGMSILLLLVLVLVITKYSSDQNDNSPSKREEEHKGEKVDDESNEVEKGNDESNEIEQPNDKEKLNEIEQLNNVDNFIEEMNEPIKREKNIEYDVPHKKEEILEKHVEYDVPHKKEEILEKHKRDDESNIKKEILEKHVEDEESNSKKEIVEEHKRDDESNSKEEILEEHKRDDESNIKKEIVEEHKRDEESNSKKEIVEKHVEDEESNIKKEIVEEHKRDDVSHKDNPIIHISDLPKNIKTDKVHEQVEEREVFRDEEKFYTSHEKRDTNKLEISRENLQKFEEFLRRQKSPLESKEAKDQINVNPLILEELTNKIEHNKLDYETNELDINKLVNGTNELDTDILDTDNTERNDLDNDNIEKIYVQLIEGLDYPEINKGYMKSMLYSVKETMRLDEEFYSKIKFPRVENYSKKYFIKSTRRVGNKSVKCLKFNEAAISHILNVRNQLIKDICSIDNLRSEINEEFLHVKDLLKYGLTKEIEEIIILNESLINTFINNMPVLNQTRIMNTESNIQYHPFHVMCGVFIFNLVDSLEAVS